MNHTLAYWIVAFLVGLSTGAQTEDPRANDPPAQTAPGSATPAKEVSEAERIARLQRAIADAESDAKALTDKLANPGSEYSQAEDSFRQLDEIFEQSKRTVERLKAEGVAQSVIDTAETDVGLLQKRWLLAKERFDLAIQERKASQTKLSAIEQKLQEDRAALAKLSPSRPVNAGTGEGSETVPTTASGTATQEGGSKPLDAPSKAAAADPGVAEPSSPVGAIPSPLQAIVPGGTASPASETHTQQPEPAQIAKARQEATSREAAAKEAEAQARSIEARITALRESIAAERLLLKTGQQQSDNSYETKRVLNDEVQTRWGAGASWAELSDLRKQIAEEDKKIATARQVIRERSDRLDDLQAELSSLQSERIIAMHNAERARQQAESADREFKALSNPFTAANLLQWLLDHGPKILGITIGMMLLLAMARVLEGRLVPVIAKHSRGAAGSVEDRENRARTLLGVLHNAMRIVVIVGGSLMLLTELGMNIVPLITAAGVVGLAIAFGAQNLIRDYFYGFIILLENQYQINDVIRISGISGLVERITLRITVLRDLEGVVHFVPHGEVKSVSNLTHGWSRALFDIGIAYKERPDTVMKVLTDLGREMRRDPEYSALILDDPEMLGVNELGDSAVVIRFLIKTRPLKQWTVKREMLRRIKNKFDELGIEIPFPHQTVYNRFESQNGDQGDESGSTAPKWKEEPYAAR